MANTESSLGPAAQQFQAGIDADARQRVVLRLYISGMTRRSQRAIENVRRLCEEHLHDRHELQIIDIYQQPELAKEQQLVAAPTLIKISPPPPRRWVGNFEHPRRFLTLIGVNNERVGEGL
jgi:circadian clock protein KaiB